MAARKRKRNPKPPSSYHRFPEVKGKIVELVEVDQDAQAILILFTDKTVLGFDVETSHVFFPELSNRKTGNWKTIKQWRPIYSPISMVQWP
jgi:hypothetical protein